MNLQKLCEHAEDLHKLKPDKVIKPQSRKVIQSQRNKNFKELKI